MMHLIAHMASSLRYLAFPGEECVDVHYYNRDLRFVDELHFIPAPSHTTELSFFPAGMRKRILQKPGTPSHFPVSHASFHILGTFAHSCPVTRRSFHSLLWQVTQRSLRVVHRGQRALLVFNSPIHLGYHPSSRFDQDPHPR